MGRFWRLWDKARLFSGARKYLDLNPCSVGRTLVCVCKVGLFLGRAQPLPLWASYPTSPPPADTGMTSHSPGIQERAFFISRLLNARISASKVHTSLTYVFLPLCKGMNSSFLENYLSQQPKMLFCSWAGQGLKTNCWLSGEESRWQGSYFLGVPCACAPAVLSILWKLPKQLSPKCIKEIAGSAGG